MLAIPTAKRLAVMLCTGAFALALGGSPILVAEPAATNAPAQRIRTSGPTLPDIDVSGAPDGIVPLPDDVDDVFKVFDRYTKIIAPNGKPIHILVEPGYIDRQVVYARKVLINHLTDLRGSTYGSDKTAIANSMADNNAILVLFYSTETMRRPAAREYFRSGVNTQDLREYETLIEGSAGYMDQDDPTRDASYEEILHFVQAYGIEPADRPLADVLQNALVAAMAGDIYLLDHDESFEYFICALEAYYDMWRHDPGGNGIREAEYVPISRVSLAEVDPTMYEVIEEFFGEFWMYTAEIATEFEGTFSLTFDEDLTYTNKSQHLTRAMLTGDNDSSLIGNAEDNSLFGNGGNNTIAPRAGFDVIDGGPGTDTAEFSGPYRDYVIRSVDGRILVDDLEYARDGSNVLMSIEHLKFADRTIDTSEL